MRLSFCIIWTEMVARMAMSGSTEAKPNNPKPLPSAAATLIAERMV
jgi:hypothetical protein